MSTPLPPERIRQLLGGYATGTLTEQERAALMQAALEDQTLFDQLMEEEALREALADRALRAELIDALAPRRRWWLAPWPWAALATATAAVALFVLLRPQPPQPQVGAMPEAREIAANLAKKPEPVPAEFAVPRKLRLSEPPAPRERRAAKTVAREDTAEAPSAQPAPASPAAQFAAVALNEKEEAKKGGAAGTFEIASQQPDGAWLAAAPGAALPAGRPLRLRFTPEATGTLALEPRLAAPLAVQAGVAAEWILPPQPRGELLLRITTTAPARMERTKARAMADSAVGGSAVGGMAAGREIRLRIE
jgi:hypothetical protein